jgi:hypothetical protein
MKITTFQDAVESSTRIFGRKDVQVVFEGEQAHTDGNVVVLPKLPAAGEITSEQANVVRGFRDHEAMHVRCTDTSPASLGRLTELTQRDAGLGSMLQYVEDIRIEHAGVQNYPGMSETLTATNTWAARTVLESLEGSGGLDVAAPNLQPELVFQLAMQAIGRKAIGVESGGVYDAMLETLKQHHPEVIKFAADAAKRVVALPTGYKDGKLDQRKARQGTAKGFDLAEQLLAEFRAKFGHKPEEQKQEEPQQQEEQQPGGQGQGDGEGQGSGQGDGQPGECQGQGDGAGQGDSGQQSSGGAGNSPTQGGPQGQQPDGQSGQGQGSQPTQGQEGQQKAGGGGGQKGGGPSAQGPSQGGEPGGNGSGNGTYSQPDIDPSKLYANAVQKVVQEVESKAAEAKGGGGKLRLFSDRLVQTLPYVQAATQNLKQSTSTRQGPALVNQFKTNADLHMREVTALSQGKKAMIRRILELELQARSDRQWTSGHTSGRLQSLRLVAAMQGVETVYQRRSDGKDMDTLLRFSMDASGSMSRGDRMLQSNTLAYSIIDAMERTGCDTDLIYWSCISNDTDKAPAQVLEAYKASAERRSQGGADLNTYTGLGFLTRGVAKRTNQRLHDPVVMQAMGMAGGSMGGYTPIFHALSEDIREMGRQNHAKKVLICLTDGRPDDPLENQRYADLAADVDGMADKAGVHLIVVGVCGAPVKIWRNNISISGADAFEPVMRHIAKYVAKEAGHAAFRRAA